MNKLKELKDIVADQYDGSYEVLRKCVTAYSNVDRTLIDLTDLDLVLMIPIGTWSVPSNKKQDLVRASHLAEKEKEQILQLIDVVDEKTKNGEYEHRESNHEGCWGMFGTGFRSVTAVCDDVSTARDFISMLVSSLNTPENKLFSLVGSLIKEKPLLGLQAGAISQVLHCLYPTTFPILNSWGRDIYNALRLRLENADKKETYISNCEIIKKFRESFGNFKNYRVLDRLSVEHAREIGFAMFVENYSNPKAILNDIDTILPIYISELTEEYKTLYQIPNADKAKEVQNVLRADEDFMKKSAATSHHRPSSCFKKYMDFFNWWINPIDPFSQINADIENGDNEEAYAEEFEEYVFSKDSDKPFISEGDFMTIVTLLKRKKNIILQGAPGVGKTFIARKLAYQLIGEVKDENIEMVQFHQSYSYEDFVQGIRPSKEGFTRRNGIFFNFCAKARLSTEEKFVFIIDEINRGNISKILGELMMLIEADKRSERYAIKLTYSEDDDKKFYVPENVYIIGCMNTADRSLAIVDYALRRRFAFCPIKPEFNEAFKQYLMSKGISENNVNSLVEKVDKANSLIATIDSGLEIGHSYFCQTDGADNFTQWWADLCEYELFPYVREICFDNEDLCNEIINKLQ